MRFALSTVSALAVASVALGQEYPDPNPVPQADGTNLWYVGNNTQYPVIQDVLDAVSDGDEVVVRGGLYVESLHIDNNEITMRPFVAFQPTSETGSYEEVIFLNPTEGFNNDNGYAMKLEGGRGTYIGIPRQFTELSNGLDVQTKIIPRNPNTYAAEGAPMPLLNIGFSSRGAFEFRSRSLDDVAIWSNSGKGTFKSAYVTSQAGLGGGIMATGSDNLTMFVDVDLESLYATGATHDESGEPVCVVNVTGDSSTRVRFHNCGVFNNDSAGYGVIYMNGADTEWFNCDISNNDSRAADGTIMAVGGRGLFDYSDIYHNQSGRGTFYWDASGTLATDEYRINECYLSDNTTVTGLYGGVAWVDHAEASGENPQITLSGCCFSNNNGLGFPNPTDPEDSYLETEADYAIHTPYMPEYRIGMDNINCGFPAQAPEADLNNDGSVDESDLDTLYDMLGMCRTDIDASGEIDFNDLLNVLVDFGNTCE
ncbi:MAG: hypothetical protein VXZ30_01445 [Planctomycetota bacterium]|nr:hypothetical protein [Planctomycetota bacterium]